MPQHKQLPGGRHPHLLLALLALQAEEALYYKSGQLVSFLREWQGTAPTIAGRYEELLVELYERQYLELMVRLGHNSNKNVK